MPTADRAMRDTDGIAPRSAQARERLLDAAYALFAEHGTGRIGVDAVIARSGCAKATLYSQFGSKDALIAAFMDRREAIWTTGWLESGLAAVPGEPEDRLLAVFDLFDDWFHRPDFEGCSFMRVLSESPADSDLRAGAARHLKTIRQLVRAHAAEAGLADIDAFAALWHILMKGSITAAMEGERAAARIAKQGAARLLAGWPRAAKT